MLDLFHHWPGNVRELTNVLEHAQILAEGHLITPDDLPETVVESRAAAPAGEGDPHHLREVERRHVLQILQQEKGNKVQAARVQPGPGRFVFIPGSRADDVMGYWQVEAEGPPGCLRVVAFHPAEDDEGLDIAAPIVVEGVLVVIRHPARGAFPAVVELQVREARRAP
ncbi:MAG TPA: hypothetical protein VKD72_25655 [Gemmataceae bacterium]|nr:hypothetical protein [Gemmataceae bacterium]